MASENHRSESILTPSWSSIRMDVLPLVDNLETGRDGDQGNDATKSKTTDERAKQERKYFC